MQILVARDTETGAMKELDAQETAPGSGIWMLRVAASNADGSSLLPSLVNGKLPVQTDERPSASAAAITPSDTVALPGGTTRGTYVGGTGNVVALIGGAAITFTAVPAGSILPVAATRVNATGTTATALVALF